MSLEQYRELILKLLDEDPSQRPRADKLFSRYQDELYQNMIISNSEEYKKIISFLFSDKNMFPSNICSIGNNKKLITSVYDRLTKGSREVPLQLALVHQ